ncbi:MAG: hypothetical protein NXI30_18940 [bacterium]|nr:hypothetical protein [bacterium]
MTEPQNKTLELSPEQVAALKMDAMRGRPVAPRISTYLAIHLVFNRENQLDYFPVLDEIEHLENPSRPTLTKPASRFLRSPMDSLYHKHYAAARHMLRNLGDRWGLGQGGNQALDNLLADVASEHGDDPDHWIGALTQRMVIGGWEDRVRKGATGEWIIFGKHEGENYYLTLATHDEGQDAAALYSRIRANCASEFPFLFSAA